METTIGMQGATHWMCGYLLSGTGWPLVCAHCMILGWFLGLVGLEHIDFSSSLRFFAPFRGG